MSVIKTVHFYLLSPDFRYQKRPFLPAFPSALHPHSRYEFRSRSVVDHSRLLDPIIPRFGVDFFRSPSARGGAFSYDPPLYHGFHPSTPASSCYRFRSDGLLDKLPRPVVLTAIHRGCCAHHRRPSHQCTHCRAQASVCIRISRGRRLHPVPTPDPTDRQGKVLSPAVLLAPLLPGPEPSRTPHNAH